MAIVPRNGKIPLPPCGQPIAVDNHPSHRPGSPAIPTHKSITNDLLPKVTITLRYATTEVEIG
ncbi:hypothetical protein L3i22_098820 [Actinoplanes sp. L3-i22]|nr:hypothetical protein L3i22_098820 [Actinoplanes sp. L3-i22]